MAKVKEQQLRMSLADEEEEEEAEIDAQPKPGIVDSYEYRVRAHTEKVVEILRKDGLIRGEGD